ncbi:Oidioi.mRNA.OKI2018_I69.chr2.g7210.t1.cds [Oikopleura dioica]|uniref:Oidioi.mRNA.OKI2018_I69.chr2.g7210.t1.cds n=1 Tax=Oikopleura dioica TaxID=34765 RepID=A0ABN7T5F1_OIKDI|nr:Oidioi.mRNA.OKI2018_I69.chr2.g7210.t1.cds [Oikopleura dioica]
MFKKILRPKDKKKERDSKEEKNSVALYLLQEKFERDEIDFEKMVRIPSGIDPREWIATHTLGLFHNINQLYDAISEVCTHCRNMNGPEKRRFTWTDDRGKAIKYSAPQHCAMVFSYCQDKLSDTTLFPTKFGLDFPDDFIDQVQVIIFHLWTVICHIYQNHWTDVQNLKLKNQLNLIFLHFFNFAKEHAVVPLEELLLLEPLFRVLTCQN